MASLPVEWIIVLGILAAGAPGAYWTLQAEGVDLAPVTTPAADLDAAADPPSTSSAVVLSGRIHSGDPTRSIFSKDALVWEQACHGFDLHGGSFTNATLWLEDGLTDGVLEDLDLYFEDGAGTIIQAQDGVSSGLGLHESAQVPAGAVRLSVCLSGGAEAQYRVDLA